METRQSTKAVATILKTAYKHSEVVYVKAGNVSDFRQQFKFVKCREVNDLHHAKDAYLNIVVGNCYYVKFTANPLNFIKKNQDSRSYSLKPEIFYKLILNVMTILPGLAVKTVQWQLLQELCIRTIFSLPDNR